MTACQMLAQSPYAMGIIGPRTRNDLVAINDIRNVFAHAPYHVKFQWNKKLKNRVLDIHMFQFVRAQHRDLSHQQCFLQTLSLYAMFIARDRQPLQLVAQIHAPPAHHPVTSRVIAASESGPTNPEPEKPSRESPLASQINLKRL